MPQTLIYTGNSTGPFFEVAITGKPRAWYAGRQQDVADADAALLLAAGVFVTAPSELTPAQKTAAQALMSGDGVLFSTRQ